jgi:hypothetical protein
MVMTTRLMSMLSEGCEAHIPCTNYLFAPITSWYHWVYGTNKLFVLTVTKPRDHVTMSHMMSHIERLFSDDTPHYSS